MKRKNLIATVAVLATTGTACGDWVLSLQHVSDNPETGTGHSAGFGPSTTWRVWIHFDEATDVLGLLGDSSNLVLVNVISGNVFNQLSGYETHQNLPPSPNQVQQHPTGWGLDTFVTVGVLTSPYPGLNLTPGFADMTNNLTDSWSTSDVVSGEEGWFVVGLPAFAHGTDLILMQLTVSQGALFELVFGVDTLQHGYLYDWDGISFAEHGQIGSGASYLTNIPGPGTAIIVAVALLRTSRGRRGRST